MESGLTRNDMLRELIRSPHGKLEQFLPVGRMAATQDPFFFSHLIAWNQKNGQIRDSKTALPVVSLGVPGFTAVENSLAHLCLLSPRDLVRALRFAKGIKTPGQGKALTRTVERYLREREKNKRWFDKTAMQHRAGLKELYAFSHIKPSTYADDILFKGKKVGVFQEIAELKSMTPNAAAAVVLKSRIPFLVAVGALGDNAKDVRFVMALIESMSPTELVTNTAMLERLGMKDVPALRAAYDAKLQAVAVSSQATLKTGVAAKASGNARLAHVAEKQLDTLAIEGNWLILADKSGSMQKAIAMAIQIAGLLTRLVKGKVKLVFFDNTPMPLDVTGLTTEQIQGACVGIRAGGGTNIGCGLTWATVNNFDADGIVVVTDGGENGHPRFRDQYPKYCSKLGKELPVYMYKLQGDNDVFSGNAGTAVQVFDLRGTELDYYSLPNLVKTMRSNQFSLVDEVISTPLLTVDEVFSRKAA